MVTILVDEARTFGLEGLFRQIGIYNPESQKYTPVYKDHVMYSAFNAWVIPLVAYTDPEVACVGLTEDLAKAQYVKVRKGLFPWKASGRVIANGCYVKLRVDTPTRKLSLSRIDHKTTAT